MFDNRTDEQHFVKDFHKNSNPNCPNEDSKTYGIQEPGLYVEHSASNYAVYKTVSFLISCTGKTSLTSSIMGSNEFIY